MDQTSVQTMAGLQWPDFLVFAIFLVISLAIGIYYALTGGRQRTTREFIMADRQLKVIPTMLSMLVSHQSAIMILGHAAEMYTRGTQAWVMMLISFTIAITVTERLIVPWIYPLKLTSINQYLEMRFESKAVRTVGSVLGICSSVLYMGAAMYAPSIALEAATGLPVAASIPIMAVVCTAYTTLGGMKAVIWTDVFQFIVMFGGILAILITGNIEVQGFGKALEYCREQGRLNWADFNPDPRVRHTVWGFLFGWTWSWLFNYGIMQASVQRYSATRTLRDARMVLLLNIPPLLIMVSIACILGLTVFAYYTKVRCDPLAAGIAKNPNQVLPLFVMTMFSNAPGVAGLFLATLYSGALSSVSSSLSAVAANTWEDILKDRFTHVKENHATLANKGLVLVYGCVSLGLAFLAAMMPGPVTQISIALMGAVSGPVFGMFLLGGLTRHANWKGALVGGLTGFALNFWIGAGSMTVKGRHNPPLPPAPTDQCFLRAAEGHFVYPSLLAGNTSEFDLDLTLNATSAAGPDPVEGISSLYTLSYIWYCLVGSLTTMLVGLIISLLTGRSQGADIPARYLIPFREAFHCSCQAPHGEEPDSIDSADVNTPCEKDLEKGDSEKVTTPLKPIHSCCGDSKENDGSSLPDNEPSAKPVEEPLITHREEAQC